ncbi:MAG: GTPase HflX [Victivallaceae bacterium]|nr:GTPase HflX [Victivallaceae bacterium]
MIDTEKDNRKLVEKAVLVGIQEPGIQNSEIREHLAELEELVENLNIGVIDRITVSLKKIVPHYYIGSGKAAEIVEQVRKIGGDCIIFDSELSPSQQRNWEKLSGLCVIDRQEVILDIFAARASTREAMLQVELARLEYSLPRLTRAWVHLSRQRGGAKGTRGEGEQQIEVDRRLVQKRIAVLTRELREVSRHRETQRKSRKRQGFPTAAIVGYTNAGKSSLLNRLADSHIPAEDKLFATLDPTTRKVTLPNNQDLLVTDTVGFIRKLPHNLVASFKSTLEEAVLADFLILILDISSSQVEAHWETTLSVLKELGADDKDILVVFNKIDLQPDAVLAARARGLFPNGVFISAVTGEGIGELLVQMIKFTKTAARTLKLRIPPQHHELIALAHEKGKVLESKYDECGNSLLTITVNCGYEKKFLDFVV